MKVLAILRGVPSAPFHRPAKAPSGPITFARSPVVAQMISPLRTNAVKMARIGTSSDLPVSSQAVTGLATGVGGAPPDGSALPRPVVGLSDVSGEGVFNSTHDRRRCSPIQNRLHRLRVSLHFVHTSGPRPE